MSSSSPQSEAAGQQAVQQSYLNSQLAGLAIPEFRLILDQLREQSSGGPGAIPGSISKAFAQAGADVDTTYAHATSSSDAAIRQRALQSGGMFAPNQINDSILGSATALERDRQRAQGNLKFQEAQAGLQQYNTLLQLMGQGSQGAIGLGQGFLGAAGSGIGGLKGTSQLGSILGGATTGAGIGTSVYPGWGTLIGAAGGAIGGAIAG